MQGEVEKQGGNRYGCPVQEKRVNRWLELGRIGREHGPRGSASGSSGRVRGWGAGEGERACWITSKTCSIMDSSFKI